jgi:hypothetical protein
MIPVSPKNPKEAATIIKLAKEFFKVYILLRL